MRELRSVKKMRERAVGARGARSHAGDLLDLGAELDDRIPHDAKHVLDALRRARGAAGQALRSPF